MSINFYGKTTIKGVAIFEYNDESKFYTLWSGSTLNPPKASMRNLTFMIRATLTDNNTTDTTNGYYSTPSLSTIASLIRGSNTGGAEFLTTCKEITKEQAQELLDGTATLPSKTRTAPSTTTATPGATATAKATATTTTTKAKAKPSKELLNKLYEMISSIDERLHNLVQELKFEPDGTELVNDRVLNNYYNTTTLKDAKNCLIDFMLLTGAPQDYIKHAEDLLKSAEFKQLFEDKENLKKYITFKKMNKRLEIYFGGAGTGKTTTALKENNGAHKLIASGTKDPETLFSFFNPNDKNFHENALARAMEEGRPIVIDEILLYNDDVLTRLQGITDNSSEFMDELLDRNITIKDGFKIVATMNLTRALPSALVSRAILKNFDRDYKPSSKERAKRQLDDILISDLSELV